MGEGFGLAIMELHKLLQLLWQLAQLVGHGLDLIRRTAAALGRKSHRQAIEGEQLSEEGLGGGDTHLDAGTDVEDVGHLTGEGTFRPVGHTQLSRCESRVTVSRPPFRLHGQSRQGVGGLAGLGHTDREGVRSQRRRCIAEFTGVMDRRGNPGVLLQQISPHERGMATGAAGEDLNTLEAGIEGIVEGKRHRRLRCQALRQMTGHPELCRLRLLMDLLEHVVAEVALVGHMIRAGQN